MTEKDDGGPANPVCVEVVHKYEDGRVGVAFFKNEGGMSLRDWFAGQALAGWLASYGHQAAHPVVSHQQDDVASLSYKMADAMLKARKGE